MQRSRPIPPAYLLAAIVTMLVLHFAIPGRQLVHWPWRWIGLIPLLGGFLLAGIAARTLVRHKTTLKPGDISRKLVSSGPFRFSRNPVYLGMVLCLVGVAVLLGSLSSWCLIPVFVWLIGRNIIRIEEAMMTETFGDEYRQYQMRVRRWI